MQQAFKPGIDKNKTLVLAFLICAEFRKRLITSTILTLIGVLGVFLGAIPLFICVVEAAEAAPQRPPAGTIKKSTYVNGY